MLKSAVRLQEVEQPADRTPSRLARLQIRACAALQCRTMAEAPPDSQPSHHDPVYLRHRWRQRVSASLLDDAGIPLQPAQLTLINLLCSAHCSDVILEKHYKGIISRAGVEAFWEEVTKRPRRDVSNTTRRLSAHSSSALNSLPTSSSHCRMCRRSWSPPSIICVTSTGMASTSSHY